MAGTGTRRAPKKRHITARRVVTVAGLGVALPVVGAISASAADMYTVKKGDTLSEIAKEHGFGSNWQALYSGNKSTVGADPNLILPGQRLNLDTKSAGRTATPSKAKTPQKTTSAAAKSTQATQASVPTTTAGIKAAAQGMMPAAQFGCFSNIVQRESGWNPQATNPSSGAYGLMQALPGSKMASAGADWRTNPLTQLKWGLGYMNSRYGSPCAAWSFWQAHNWY